MVFFLWCLCCALFSSLTHKQSHVHIYAHVHSWILFQRFKWQPVLFQNPPFYKKNTFSFSSSTKWLRKGLLQHSCHHTALHFCPLAWLAKERVMRIQERWLDGDGWFLFGGNCLENCTVLLSVNDITESDMPSSRQKQLSVVV